MLFKKILTIVLTAIAAIICFSAFQSIADSDLSTQPELNTDSDSTTSTIQADKFSNEFYQIKNQILFQKTDSSEIQSKILKLYSPFEKEYLQATHLKKLTRYDAAYELLFKYLKSYPNYFDYYDDLISVSKITGSLELIQNEIKKNVDTGSVYYLYPAALINFNTDSYSNSVDELLKIVDKEIGSKEIYYLLATNYRATGDYEEALQVLLKAKSLCDDDDLYLPKILNGIGSIYYLSSYYNKALEFYTLASSLAEKTGNTVEYVKAQGNLAIIDDIYGEVDEARIKLVNAINISQEIKNVELLAFLYSELGVSFTYTNNIIEARSNYKKSFQLYSDLNNRERLSYLSSNIGSIYLQQNNYRASLDSYTKGLNLAGENILAQILNLIGIADVYSNISNYSQALEYYNKAQTLADSVKDVSSLIKIDEGIGSLFFNTNRPFNALEILKNAEQKLDAEHLPFEAAGLYHKIGIILTSIDSLDSAIEYFKRGIELTEITDDIYNNFVLKTELANALLSSSKFNEAKIVLDQVYKRTKEYELVQLLGLQNLYYGKISFMQKNLDSARENFELSFKLSLEAENLNTAIEAGYYLARLYTASDQKTFAEEWFNKTIEIIERVSLHLYSNQHIQIAHFSGLNEVYNSFIDFYIEQNRNTEAFELLERSRSRNTLQNVYRLKLISQIGDENKIEKYIDTEWMISSNLYSRASTDSLKDLLSQLKLDFLDETSSIFELNPWFDIKSITSKLSESENFVSLFINNDQLHVFHLNSKGLISENISISSDSLNKIVGNISPFLNPESKNLEVYTNQDLFSFNASASNDLYRILIKSVIEKIPEEDHIIFSLPAELLSLPMEFLTIGMNGNESQYYYDDKDFLISRNSISYAPSASIYIMLKDRNRSDNEQNLFVGDPEISNTDFALSYRSGLLGTNGLQGRNIELFPLSYSKYEVESVNNILPAGKVLLSGEATETNFKLNAEQSNLIHISTHSFLFKDQPLIILSHKSDEDNDGYLEAQEIIELDLKSDMVVLSSCRSGLGRIDESEGVIGMQKAFFEAGANSVVVSLWDVSDKYTSILMELFYENISNGMTKPESLRKAKIKFISDYSSNPYYWSSFVLAGNPSAINLETSSFQFKTILYLLAGFLILLLLFRFLKSRLTA